MFGTETVSMWRSMLDDGDWDVRYEALHVLSLAIHYGTLPLLRLCHGVCAHKRTDDLRHSMFDAETVSIWRSMLQDETVVVRQEALIVLVRAMSHGILPRLYYCPCSERDRWPS